MDENNRPIPMIERWSNDIPIGTTIGYEEVTNEERIKARISGYNLLIKIGKLTQEEADEGLQKLYEELGVLAIN